MAALIHQHVREMPREGLGDHQVGHIAAGDEERVFRLEKGSQTFFQLAIKARGFRSSNARRKHSSP